MPRRRFGMKYLVLLLVVVVGLYLLRGRSTARRTDDGKTAAPRQPPETPAPMLKCAHCGVHVPRDDSVLDAAGRAFCSDAHRLAGPRG